MDDTRKLKATPREATPEMVEAGGLSGGWRPGEFDEDGPTLFPAKLWRTMWDAAPTPAIEAEEGVPLEIASEVIEAARAALAHLANTLPQDRAELRLAAAYAGQEASRLAAALILVTPSDARPHPAAPAVGDADELADAILALAKGSTFYTSTEIRAELRSQIADMLAALTRPTSAVESTGHDHPGKALGPPTPSGALK